MTENQFLRPRIFGQHDSEKEDPKQSLSVNDLNEDHNAVLESATNNLRMATIERKRMSSINAESRGVALGKKSRQALVRNTAGAEFGVSGQTIDVPRRQSRFNQKKNIEMIELENFIQQEEIEQALRDEKSDDTVNFDQSSFEIAQV